MNAFIKIRNTGISINNPTFHLNEPEKMRANKNQRKVNVIIKIRVEKNKIENRKTVQKINKVKCWHFEKINKLANPQLD